MKLLRKNRLLLVGGVVLVLGAGAGGAVLVRLRMIQHRFMETRQRGVAEFKDGQLGRALGDLGSYLGRYPSDTEVLADYADARLKIEEPDGSHLGNGIGVLRRLADIQQAAGKDVTAIRRRLASLYLQNNLNSECSLTCEQLLPHDLSARPLDPSDGPVLRDYVLALFRLRKFDDARKANEKYIAFRPEDLEAQVLQLEILTHIGPTTQDLVKYASSLNTAQPNDVRWKILLSIAYAMSNDGANARLWAKNAQASGKAPDAVVAALETQQLWRTGEIALGDAWLEESAGMFKDATLQLLWARRLFQLNQFAALEKMDASTLVAAPEAEAGALESQQADLRGYQAVSWVALRQLDKAKAAQKALAEDPYSLYAHDWAIIVAHLIDPASTTFSEWGRNIIPIAARHAENGYFQLVLGAYLQSKSDYRSAMKAWEDAAVREPAWSEPIVLGAQILLQAQRAPEAMHAAQAALSRNPDDRDAMVLLALATAANHNDKPDPQALLALLEKIRTRFPQDQRTLGLRVSVRAQVQGKSDGIAALQQTLAMNPTPPLAILLQLAAVSRTNGLGQEDACFATAEKAFGMSPDLALAKAQFLADDGHPDQGLALLKDYRAKATTDLENWDIAYARYLEMTHDADAKPEWLALSNKYPNDSRAQWLVLSAPSIQADHDAAGKIIERLRPLIGDADFSLKLARARWLLEDKPNQTQINEASSMLAEMAKGSPDVLAPHLLLAQCFEQTGNETGAIEQLQMAVALSPDSSVILIELTRLLENQGSNDRARVYLQQLTATPGALTDSERQQCAGLLARIGDPDKAITLMESGVGPDSGSQASRLMLASLYAERGQNAKAQVLINELMKQPTLEVIRLAYSFYAVHGRMQEAQHAMDQLASLHLDPAAKAAEEGDFAARFGKPEDAVASYQAALKEDPSDGQIWRRLIALQLSQGLAKDAQDSIDHAIAALPHDKGLAALAQDKPAMDALDADPQARPILTSLVTSPQHLEAARAVLDRLTQNKTKPAGDVQLALDVTRLADRYPQYAALQVLAVQCNVAAGHLDDAVTIASRAMQTFPASADSARIAAAVFAASGRWAETLGASTEWRDRDPSQPLDPDVMIGRSYLAMGKPQDSLKQIQPYLASAASNPETYAGVIELYGRIQLAQGHPGAAEDRLWPFAKSSRAGLISFLQIAAEDAPPDVAKRWFAMAKTELHGDMGLVYEYARAMAGAAKRTRDRSFLATADADVAAMIAASDAPAPQKSSGYLAAGMLHEAVNNAAAAETEYRKAVELNPKNDAALNNLAMVLARKNSLDEALKYAAQAIEIAPNVAAYQDTLAFVQDKAGDHASAIDHLRTAMQLQPGNFEWRVNLAQIYVNAGQSEKARSMLVNSDGSALGAGDLMPDVRDHLSQLDQKLGIRL